MSAPRMRLAFVGGTRFIGHAAAAWAVSRGHDVSVLHRGRHPCEVPGARDVIVDRGDPSALCLALARLAPDAIVDTRAMTRADAEVTALASKVTGAPVVVLSSQDVYAQFGRFNGLPAPAPEALVSESSPLTVPFPYRGIAPHEGGPDYDKKLVEAVFRGAAEGGAPGACALRLPAVYGARDPKRRFGSLVDRLDAGERALPCQGGASWRWTHAHVRDAANAIVLAAEHPAAGFRVFNVGEAVVPTMRERAESIVGAMGVRVTWEERAEPLPDDLAWLGAMPNDFVADTSALRRALGEVEVTTPRERVEDLVAWLRESRARSD